MENNKISFSNKIYLISFILSVMIVYLHSLFKSNSETLLYAYRYLFNLENICVPMFFMISGYLFYRNFSIDKLLYKYKSRFKSLFIPYLIWNIIAFLYSFCISKFAGANVEIPNGILSNVYKILNSNYSVLWFVKYLMIFTLLSPLIYYLMKRKSSVLIIIGCVVFLGYSVYSRLFPDPIDLKQNNIYIYIYEGIYYLIGCYAAINFKNQIEQYSKSRSIFSLIILTLLLIANIFMARISITPFIWELYRILFCIVLFFTFDLLNDISVKWWMKISFFIYCFHMYPLQLSQELIIKLTDNKYILFLSYLIMPALIVLLSVFVAKFMSMAAPTIWRILNGGRAENQKHGAK